jgi:hypothetical protein
MAKINLFCSNSLRGALTDLIPAFERASGHHVEVSYDPAKVMMERVGRGETADAIIIGGEAIDELVKQGKVAARSRRFRELRHRRRGAGGRAQARHRLGGSIQARAARREIHRLDPAGRERNLLQRIDRAAGHRH